MYNYCRDLECTKIVNVPSWEEARAHTAWCSSSELLCKKTNENWIQHTVAFNTKKSHRHGFLRSNIVLAESVVMKKDPNYNNTQRVGNRVSLTSQNYARNAVWKGGSHFVVCFSYLCFVPTFLTSLLRNIREGTKYVSHFRFHNLSLLLSFCRPSPSPRDLMFFYFVFNYLLATGLLYKGLVQNA